MHDLAIRGGALIDGVDAPPRRDVPAEGLPSAPSCVDIRPHYEAALAEGIESCRHPPRRGWRRPGVGGLRRRAYSRTERRRIGRVRLSELRSDARCGGTGRDRRFMTGSQSLYAAYVETRGAEDRPAADRRPVPRTCGNTETTPCARLCAHL